MSHVRTAVAISTTLVAAAGSITLAAPSATAVTTCNGLAPVSQLSATTYADRLIRAWGRGDTRTTACYTSAAARSTLWAISDTGGAGWARTGVEGAAGTIYVTYTQATTRATIVVGVQNIGLRGSGGWHAAYTARSSGRVVHAPRADAFVRSWGQGDRTAAAYFGTATSVNQLFSWRSRGGGQWYLVRAEGTAGSTYSTYRDRTSGHVIVVRALDPGATGSWAHDVVSVSIR
ncbi:hypothetical protein ACSDQ9_09860 [Aestuariimicrobium soli]|uniref:hypothetical protein n=1 Tax=Aestuariimicrobium soli TaxID=2035834 RepID=UPI003EBB6274